MAKSVAVCTADNGVKVTTITGRYNKSNQLLSLERVQSVVVRPLPTMYTPNVYIEERLLPHHIKVMNDSCIDDIVCACFDYDLDVAELCQRFFGVSDIHKLGFGSLNNLLRWIDDNYSYIRD